MATQSTSVPSASVLRNEQQFVDGLRVRHRTGNLWMRFFQGAIVVGLLALFALMFNVVNRIAGYAVIVNETEPTTLSDRPLEELEKPELERILLDNARASLNLNLPLGSLIPGGLGDRNANYIANRAVPISQLLPNVPAEFANLTFDDLSQNRDAQVAVLSAVTSQADMYDLVLQYIVGQRVEQTWTITDSLFNRAGVDAWLAEWQADSENAGREPRLEFRNWLSLDFFANRMSTNPLISGIRIALFGTMWVLLFTLLVAFPLGVGTAIYLEEYSTGGTWLERVIETNIRNLAGVPSIIYGLLGLAIFVRFAGELTDGRTIISAALTMSLLILPIIIINSQEALRAVPPSIREASFGLGATKWQTVWNQVLPAAMPGILTGTILGMSRAIGETAPLIIIGAATFIVTNPTGPLARFTVIPIQIYNWTKDARPGFGEIAAAAIVLLLIVLLLFNATAIILRQRFRKSLSG
jgi:phosphate transport system permease protein